MYVDLIIIFAAVATEEYTQLTAIHIVLGYLAK